MDGHIVIKKNTFGTFDVVKKVLGDYDSKNHFIYFGINGGSGFKDVETAQSFAKAITMTDKNVEVE